jgi:hypothetical protein
MGGKRNQYPSTEQADLFASPLFPVRQRTERVRPVDLSLRIKTAMGQALKECPDSAGVIAAKMTELTGREITPDALYAYTAPSKPEHEIGIVRFVAFVRATNAPWLYDVLVEDEGLIVMEGREAHLTQLGLAQQERSRLDETIKFLHRELKARPVVIRRRPGGR